ncbi:succinyl-diaminopimelate desuccinylase [Acidiphilium iwatense]|uniref:Succinyl-diaminopimelate desuccinylase n=1 Tax=Acidiphilium iwatense TaxID=768198 RepID=A0ABS9DT03_9PROT|nr:succinyl-diaminopimelate desuccinylase [Acidiphilium iwatense]MCF3945856.1 succinyl-diaminopimelate desuccinylase [Acidiphilium iwatense]
MTLTDPLPLAQALIRCPSVTPEDAGAQSVIADALDRLGFAIETSRHGAVDNLVARYGAGAPHFAFAGHTDVVPPGEGWRCDPFAGIVQAGVLFGRGAVDMKGAIAAFIAALAARRERGGRFGTLSMLITGDEEGDAIDGTRRILDRLAETATMPDACLVGEPTCRATLGDTVKIGRRGSVSARILVRGTQGHVAYPHLADNPLHRLIPALDALRATPLDTGTAWFEPSSLQITSVDVGNRVGNVIPDEARAALNIRFNDRHTGAGLGTWITETIHRFAPDSDCAITIGGEAFLAEPGPFTQTLSAAIRRATGIEPKLDTSGGTSDARFIAAYCPVAEFGLIGRTMHRADESVPVAELRDLAHVYGMILDEVFG